MVIGANVGTTITAVIGALTSNADGKRLALADVIFKVSAGIVFIAVLNQIAGLVDSIAAAIGLANDDYTLKLAIFHTIFNVAGVVIMVPFVNQLVQIVSKVIPDKQIVCEFYKLSPNHDDGEAIRETVYAACRLPGYCRSDQRHQAST